MTNSAFASNVTNEVQRLTLTQTNVATPISGTFTLTFNNAPMVTRAITVPVPYDPFIMAARIQHELDRLFSSDNLNGGLVTPVMQAPALGLGNFIVTPSSPFEFTIAFQRNVENANLPQLGIATALTGGTAAMSTFYEGVGNAVAAAHHLQRHQRLHHGLRRRAANLAAYVCRGHAFALAADRGAGFDTIPALNGNIFVFGPSSNNPAAVGPFFVVLKGGFSGVGVAGTSVPNTVGVAAVGGTQTGSLFSNSSDGNDNTTSFTAGLFSMTAVTSVAGIPSFAANGGTVGVGTDNFTSGGVQIIRRPISTAPARSSTGRSSRIGPAFPIRRPVARSRRSALPQTATAIPTLRPPR